ncbi:TPA: phage tail tape measure protein [Corynebacterium striatum]|nr:phage tail tape measure protein [Corynebacterium striatum]HAT1159087.1 phage tail tape measure protein [Corynebacterium striatum]HAT1161792.1 phage tail tape measure protein [Corynebacterium striatum]HAT1164546.1 phage tail tape measure protein [Corynebacterium striatum]HAT1277702.1 phage tail tape measure protein [Corynebacterium striatum]
MALEVGTLNARIKVDTTGVSSTLGSVKRDLNDVKKSAERVEKNNIDVTPKGADKLGTAGKSAKSLGDNLRDAGSQGKQLSVNGQVATELEKAAGAGGKLKGVFESLSGVAGMVGLGAAVGGVGAAFNDMIKTGMAYRSELNTMNAVSGATASQMKQVADAAKQLGNDTELANTSAGDAAAAMTELAKGGFTVEQSIGAAKGTLQLAAAAQVDAATAATIQSQALQAFSLDAGNAARVSDILAGAANASSAEMTGISQGLQQAGTVANQFGVSIDDTATTLAMFANAGIQGSDAGTLMKTALLALTDQGKPAQQAIEELGLTVYDANGKFVGMQSLMEQLQDASSRMTDEQYQAATATLFGSDAMRLAGIAAEQGGEGFEKLKGAVTRQGQAAEVAAAQTEGLPGAIGRVQNAWETAQTQIYEATEGGMVAALDLVTGGLEGAANLITGPGFAIGGQILENIGGQAKFLADGATAAGNAIADVLVPGAEDMASAFGIVTGHLSGLNDGLSSWAVPVASAAVVTFASKFLGLTGKLNEGTGAIARFGQEMQVQKSLAKGFGKDISTVGAAVDVLRTRHEGLDRALSNASRSYLASSAGLRTLSSQHRAAALAAKNQALESTNAFTTIDRIGSQMGHSFIATTTNMGAHAKGFASGGLAVMKGAMGGVGKAAGGLIDAMGGPWSLAIMGASWAIGELVKKHQEAKQAEEEHKQAQEELRGSLDETTGAITNQTNELINKKLQESGAADAARELGLAQDTVRDAVNGNADAMREVKVATEGAVDAALQSSDTYQSMAKDMEKAGISAEDVRKALMGNQDAMDKINGSSWAMWQGNQGLWNALSKEMENTTGSAITLGKEVGSLNGDLESVKADALRDKLNGLKNQVDDTTAVFEKLGDDIVAVPDEKTIQVSSMAPKVKTELEELGLEVKRLEDGSDRVNIEFPEGHNILTTLDQLGAKVTALPDGRMDITDNADDVKQRLIDLGLAVKDETTGQVTINDNIADVIAREIEMGTAVTSNADKTGHVHIFDNMADVMVGLEQLGFEASKDRNGNVIISDNTGDTVDRLKAMGIEAEKQRDGKVRITDNAEATRQHIQSTLSRERTNTVSEHMISITRRIKDIFERANGGIDMPVETYASGGHRDKNVDRAVARRANSNHEPSHQAHIAPAGSYRVFAESETGGEAYIPLAENKRDRSEQILSKVAGMFGYELIDGQTGEVQAFADGAVLPASVVKKKLQFMNRTPYIFGGWSPAGVDCSGAVSLGVNVAEGLDPWDSRTATAGEAAWLQAKGYKQGKGSSGDIRVAFYNGGPGGGHTAMQLDDGTFIESGGNTGGGFTIGAPAGPLEGRGFTDWYYKRGATALTNEGLDAYDSLNGVIGAPGVGSTLDAMRSTLDDDSITSGKQARELNGGTGTLLKDGSFLEAMAALYSLHTGQPMDDDIVSWGQVVGLYSKAAEESGDKLTEDSKKALESLEKKHASLEDAKADLPLAEEDLRIKKMKRDETYNKTDKNGNKTATDSQKAAADQAVDKAEKKVQETKEKIAKLEKEIQELEAKQAELELKAVNAQANPSRSGDWGLMGEITRSGAASKLRDVRGLLADAMRPMAGNIIPMANGGILGGLRQAQINDGSSAVLWAEAGPEAYIPLSSDKRARSTDIWLETGKRLGYDVMSMINLIGSGLPGLMQGRLDFSTGGTISAEALGLNMDAAKYRAGKQIQNSVGAVFNGPVRIEDPQKYLQGQLDNAHRELGKAMRSFML